MPHLFCFGFSWTAGYLAKALERDIETWKITATFRQTKEGPQLAREGIEPVLFGTPACDKALLSATHILVSIPPGKGGDPALLAHKEALAKSSPSWIGYLSTTGPYGDCGGAWVDETAPVNPSGPRGKRRADAEAAWTDLSQEMQLPLHIFRLPGLYGPGRSALERVKEGSARRIVKPGQVFSRIHIADLATILLASMKQPNPGAIYNVADDHPAPPQDVTAFAAELLGVEPPPETPYEEADLSPMAKSFYSDNKRISNRRIKEELGVDLKYSNYREGLKAILDARSEKQSGHE